MFTSRYEKKVYFSVAIAAFTIIVCCVSCISSVAQEDLQKVVIIRHGEKVEKGDNLSCQGFNRSLQLPAVLYNKFKLPTRIYVPALNAGKTTNQSRMYQTIIPFAIKYNLKIDTRFNVDDTESLGENILKQKGYVLVVWEHNNIADIAHALGISEILKWKDKDFDSIIIITFKKGKPVLNFDKENLNPSPDCN